jgi:hypothetical protein
MEVSGQLHVYAALTTGKSHWYPLDSRLGGPRGRCGIYGEVKFLTLSALRPRTLGRPSRSQSLYRMGYSGFSWSFMRNIMPRQTLWSIGQSPWLQIQTCGFDSRSDQIFWVEGLERGPLNLGRTIEELLGRKCSGSDLKNREYGHKDLSRWPRGILHPQKLVLISPTNGGRSVGIVRSQTQATEFFYYSRLTQFLRAVQLDSRPTKSQIRIRDSN